MVVFLRTTGYLLKAQARTALFAILFASALAGMILPLFISPDVSKAVVICDNDNSALSRSLVQSAGGKTSLATQSVDSGGLPRALQQLRSGVVEAVFVVGKGYGESMKAGEYKNLVQLYLSPYSTSGRTYSDSMAALVMSQWLSQAIAVKAREAGGVQAGAEALRLYAESSELPILLLRVEGRPLPPQPASLRQRQAENAFIILAALSCFLVLCFSSANLKERDELLDRFSSRGWDGSCLFFAQSTACAAAPALAALIPSVLIGATFSVAAGLMAYLMFLLYLAAWVGISVLMNFLIRNLSIQLTVASIIAILNFILVFPAGLSLGFGQARVLFAGYWLSAALQQGWGAMGLVPLCACALVACLAGIFVFRIKRIQPRHTQRIVVKNN